MRSPTHNTVWRGMTCDRASKSNILARSLLAAPSAETIGAVEEVAHVGANRIFQRREAAIISGARELIDLALGEVLVAVANRDGHIDIFDVRLAAERRVSSEHEILETARLA